MSSETPSAKPLLIHNTLSRRKEVFEPLEKGKVRMYNCGPTVYDYFHVGNARNFVCADMIRRYLEYCGYDVTFVQNITDIDDKIIARAREEGCSCAELAEKYTRVFFESAAALGVRKADRHPRATEYVEKMVDLIRKLEAKGFAYAAEGDVYFRVSAFQEYGKLSGRNVEDLLSGARVEVSERKESPADFALWKASKEGEPFWPSPWGDGRPGWHTECCVMSMDLLGETLDIHMGGNDLCFPHHENELAQSEALTGKPFVRYWIHNGFLNIDGEKMSKSLGNFFTINEVLDKFEAPVVRYFLLSAHYRVPLDFSDAALEEAKTALTRLREARKTARELAGKTTGEITGGVRAADSGTGSAAAAEGGRASCPPSSETAKMRGAFEEAMNDDFNTPRALAVLFHCAGEINKLRAKALEGEKTGTAVEETDRAEAFALGALLDRLGGEVLGLDLEVAAARVEDLSADLLELMIGIRAQARREKQWSLADAIRDGLEKLGFELLDRPGGRTVWKRKSTQGDK